MDNANTKRIDLDKHKVLSSGPTWNLFSTLTTPIGDGINRGIADQFSAFLEGLMRGKAFRPTTDLRTLVIMFGREKEEMEISVNISLNVSSCITDIDEWYAHFNCPFRTCIQQCKSQFTYPQRQYGNTHYGERLGYSAQ